MEQIIFQQQLQHCRYLCCICSSEKRSSYHIWDLHKYHLVLEHRLERSLRTPSRPIRRWTPGSRRTLHMCASAAEEWAGGAGHVRSLQGFVPTTVNGGQLGVVDQLKVHKFVAPTAVPS
jgi:hypothetical protein